MNNILHYPNSTIFNKDVPKTTFYRHMEVNTRMKAHFVNDVVKITWLYKLAPSTLNVEDGNEVHEIVVFLVALKKQDCPNDVFMFIDTHMPRQVVFILQFGSAYKLVLNYKEWQDKEQTKFSIIKSFATEWLDIDDISLPLEGLSMDRIYESMAKAISGIDSNSREDTKKIVALQEEIQKHTRLIEALQKKVRTERQIARQMEMNSEARAIKRHIAELNKQLDALINK